MYRFNLPVHLYVRVERESSKPARFLATPPRSTCMVPEGALCTAICCRHTNTYACTLSLHKLRILLPLAVIGSRAPCSSLCTGTILCDSLCGMPNAVRIVVNLVQTAWRICLQLVPNSGRPMTKHSCLVPLVSHRGEQQSLHQQSCKTHKTPLWAQCVPKHRRAHHGDPKML